MSNAVAFDFDRKSIQQLQTAADIANAIAGGRYCWIDFDDIDAALSALPELGVDAASLARVDLDEEYYQARHGAHNVYCALAEAQMTDTGLQLNTVHVFLAKNLFVTVHGRASALIESVRETYEHDFRTTAESGGFLLFELTDHLIIGYRATLAALTAEVDGIQRRLLGDVGDEILTDVSKLTRALLQYRNAVVAARETIDELATRRSAFVNASTQPFLDRQTVPLDRLAHDAATERTVLSEALNLYMGIVGHRTNKVVNRLTVVSMIFLPLNFLAAVYGMNFETMPEFYWRYGYAAFWTVILLLVVALLVIFRRRHWI